LLKFASVYIPSVTADGCVALIHRDTIATAIADFKVAKIVRRKRDGAIVRVFSKAEPGEIARPSHRTATVIHDLPNNYSHNMRACAAYA